MVKCYQYMRVGGGVAVTVAWHNYFAPPMPRPLVAWPVASSATLMPSGVRLVADNPINSTFSPSKKV